MASTQVTVNGTPAPIFYATPTQLGIQIPFEVTGTPATVAVVVSGDANASTTINVGPVSPRYLYSNVGWQRRWSDYACQRLGRHGAESGKNGEVVIVYATGLGSSARRPHRRSAGGSVQHGSAGYSHCRRN